MDLQKLKEATVSWFTHFNFLTSSTHFRSLSLSLSGKHTHTHTFFSNTHSLSLSLSLSTPSISFLRWKLKPKLICYTIFWLKKYISSFPTTQKIENRQLLDIYLHTFNFVKDFKKRNPLNIFSKIY